MTPVDQTEFWTGEPGSWGNCESAVIASLLDLSITEVPHFLREAKGDNVKFWENVSNFLEKYGFEYVHYAWNDIDWEKTKSEGKTYHTISGPSPRAPDKIWHAVVGCNGEIIHDPHYSREGLYGSNKMWHVSMLRKIEAI